MTSPITKAVIPVAGWGTRRLPITKAIEKCMLPIGNRPIVDYVVQDCINAGITDIYFVVGENSQQIRTYYGENEALEIYLKQQGKDEALKTLQAPQAATFHYITQPAEGKYGTAVPVALVAPYIEKDESVVVLMGDDFIYNQDGSSEVARLIAAVTDDNAAMLGVNVPKSNVSKYGVIETDSQGNYVKIVEKPQPQDAPSTLINVSKYVLPARLIEAAESVAQDASGEYFLTTVMNEYVDNGGVLTVVQATGEYYDGGSLAGWLHANSSLAQTDG